MKIEILASGSGGNCIALQAPEGAILVDAGIAKTKIEKRLLDVGIRPDSIAAIFITHAHSDHIKGLPLANKYKIPVFAAEGEWKDIQCVEELLKSPFKAGDSIHLKNRFYIETFSSHHDALDPVGYVISDFHGNKVSICLDTGIVDEEMLAKMEYSTAYIIEANHDPAMVEASDYPNSVKARIVSDVGHLSNQQTAEALSFLVKGISEQIYLTHLSSSNNMPGLAEMTVKRILAKKGIRPDKYKLEVI
ncbi:MBL fold metallo-hydrolase [Bacillus sp. FJAT-27225]|uniref:MBL fold metallo-hydrolase n=1 Tax=Bacillus sp. FJAT-27225 TaxID=1743144 RepID=UPI00080C2303|nr:MBL fold metallo-hydrolase [Bacillus sp. FJAT-27225]OCA84464.1 MBL fold metallo-hydrolase [Bacillus sp. FJAT-27225]